MNPKEIIKRQEEKIFDILAIEYGHIEINAIEKLKNNHSSSIKEILEGIVVMEKGKIINDKGIIEMIFGNNTKTLIEADSDRAVFYNEAKSDTINHLESIIKKL